MKRHALTLELTVRGPVLTKSSAPSSFGLDAAVARIAHGPETGKPCLPGTLIKGKVRESLIEIGSSEPEVEALLGKDTENGSGNEPLRGRILFGDLIADKIGGTDTCSRIAIDHILGSAMGQMLRVIETPFAPGEPVQFTGTAWCYGNDDAEKAARLKLLQGLSWLTQIGANRTTGFGRLTEVAVRSSGNTPLPLPPASTGVPANVCALQVALRPLGPLCISRHKIGDNLFESDDIIPGNMIAGALVETWSALCELPAGATLRDCAAKDSPHAKLAAHFDQIRFRHAFPALETDARPGAIPLSTVKAGKKPYDVASCRNAVLLQDDTDDSVAPEFTLDWKDASDVRAKLGWASPERELRVRTAIDAQKRTADRGDNGDGGKLFAWEMIHPFTEKGEPIVWHTSIDLEGVLPETDRQVVADALAFLLPQIGFLSKTKTVCDADVKFVTAPSARTSLIAGNTLTLVLQSPALLADPRFQEMSNKDFPKGGALSASEMFALNCAVWTELSDGSLALSHHFAQQFLAGGNHLAKRFQQNRAYDPWLLTAAGSVFVFKVMDTGKASEKLMTWLATGLPLPAWAKKRYGDSWRTNPYLPQNGFGEIALHQPIFTSAAGHPVALADSILPAS